MGAHTRVHLWKPLELEKTLLACCEIFLFLLFEQLLFDLRWAESASTSVIPAWPVQLFSDFLSKHIFRSCSCFEFCNIAKCSAYNCFHRGRWSIWKTIRIIYFHLLSLTHHCCAQSFLLEILTTPKVTIQCSTMLSWLFKTHLQFIVGVFLLNSDFIILLAEHILGMRGSYFILSCHLVEDHEILVVWKRFR